MPYLLITWLLWPLLFLRTRLRRQHGQPRILVIQLAKIGDAICATPVFRALATAFPHGHLSVLANPITAPLLRQNPHLDAVIPFSPGALAGWRGKLALARIVASGHYDTVVCLNAGLAYPLACFWAGIPRRVAVMPNFCGRTYRWAATLWSAVEPHRGTQLIQQTYLNLLGHLGIHDHRLGKEVFSSSDAEAQAGELLASANGRQLLGVGVSSANKLKELGRDKLLQVLGELLDRHQNLACVLIGSAADEALASEIAASLKQQGRVINACGRFNLEQLPALLSRLSVYLGVDSGITYMADALGIPLVSVAGPCNMEETRPVNPKAIILQEIPPCGPCAHIFRAPYQCKTGTLECLKAIQTGAIVAAVERCLNK